MVCGLTASRLFITLETVEVEQPAVYATSFIEGILETFCRLYGNVAGNDTGNVTIHEISCQENLIDIFIVNGRVQAVNGEMGWRRSMPVFFNQGG